MTGHALIRPEDPADTDAIHDLTARAFSPMAFSDGSEPQIIRRLRARGQLVLSLVATDASGRIIGHVAFSEVTLPCCTRWLGLGPIAVDPALQRRGTGRALVLDALPRLRALGWNGIALIGNPAVYAPMGFVSHGLLTHGDLPPALVQHMTLSGPDPQGTVQFASAFDV